MQRDIIYHFEAEQLETGGYFILIQREAAETALPNFAIRRIEKIQVVGTDSLSKILAAGSPIEIGDNFVTESLNPRRPRVHIGRLILRSSSPEKRISEPITHSHSSGGFEVIYRRSVSPEEVADDTAPRADDAAMIVRLFMLAKIATARLEMRTTLLHASTNRAKLVALKTIISESEDRNQKNAAQATLKELLHRLETAENGAAPAKTPYALDAIENTLALIMEWIRRKIQQHKKSVYILSVSGFVSALGWVWVPYVIGYHQPWWPIIGWCLVAGLGASGILFLLNALNLKSFVLRIEEKIYEETVERLNVTLAAVVQTNANVAAINLVPEPQEGFPSELLLHQMDQVLHMKERLVSIERVIKSREVHLASNVKHIEEHRDSVRRSITAAGSGVFIGFFTYEVGESVMDYLHVAHQEDQKAMLQWLLANSERIGMQAKLSLPNKQTAATPSSATKTGATHSLVGEPKLDTTFESEYHKPELYAQSWLLTITIVVTILTAWIAVRKPAAEQGGGHAHH